MGVLLRADLTEQSHPILFGRKGWPNRARPSHFFRQKGLGWPFLVSTSPQEDTQRFLRSRECTPCTSSDQFCLMLSIYIFFTNTCTPTNPHLHKNSNRKEFQTELQKEFQKESQIEINSRLEFKILSSLFYNVHHISKNWRPILPCSYFWNFN